MPTFFEDIKTHVDFGEGDASALRGFLPLARPHFDRVAEQFYERLHNQPRASAVLDGPVQIERLKRALTEWMESGLRGPHDEAFFERRARIGRVHVRRYLPQQYMVTAMNVIRLDFRGIADAEYARAPETGRIVNRALDKLFDLELAIMLDSYQQTEAGLRNTLVDTVHALLLVLDGDGRVVHANPAVAAVTGRSPEDLVGTSWVHTCLPESDREDAERMLRSLRGGTPAASLENRIVCRRTGGEVDERWVSWRWSYVADPRTGDDYIYASGLDVTELRKLQYRTQMARRLESIGTLTAGLAHEVRNPLNSANLQLHLLERRIHKLSDDPALHRPLKLVQDEVTRLSTLVGEFLTFARPADLRVEELDLTDLVGQLARAVRPELASRDVEVVVIRSGEPVTLVADREKLRQVVHNLVTNAADAMETGGAIAISITSDPVDVRISVRDTGPGIPDEAAVRVFEPFYTTKSHGTGLGMTICFGIVSQHGGDIQVRSNEGAEFTITLPRSPRSAPDEL